MHIIFDIGKTKTRVAGSRDLEFFTGSPEVFETPKDYFELIAAVKGSAKKILGEEKPELMGGGIGGPLSKEKQSLGEDSNFPGWGGKPICGDLWAAVGAPVFLENDAALVGLGEAVHGAGQGNNIVAYITVSTGVGGARIVNGKVDASALGFEPGWQVLSLDGKYASDYLSGAAVELQTGKKPYETTDLVFWEAKAKVLAFLLNNVVVMWSPDIIVVGGSMMNDIGISIPQTETYLSEILKIFPQIPPVKHSSLKDFGGLYGAMEFLKDKRQLV